MTVSLLAYCLVYGLENDPGYTSTTNLPSCTRSVAGFLSLALGMLGFFGPLLLFFHLMHSFSKERILYFTVVNFAPFFYPRLFAGFVERIPAKKRGLGVHNCLLQWQKQQEQPGQAMQLCKPVLCSRLPDLTPKVCYQA